MILHTVDVGIAPNDGTGDNIRDAFVKVNTNTQTLNSLLYENTQFASATVTSLIADTVVISNSMTVMSGTDSASPSNGSLVLSGGMGVGKNLNVGSNISAVNGTFSNDLLVQGNLTVEGNLTTINSSTLEVVDVNITVAKNATSELEADGAGLTVGGSGAAITFNGNTDQWVLNRPINVNTVVSTDVTGTLQTNAQPNVTSVGMLNGLAVSGLSALGNVLAAEVATANLQVTGGNLDGVVIGHADPRNGTFANLTVVNGITGVLQTPAQPNVTSVGTLTSLTVNGTITADQLNIPSGATANVSVITTGNAQITGGSITNTPIGGSTGSFTTLSATNGNITTLSAINGNISSLTSSTITATDINGTLQTPAQPNITSVGALTNLAVSGNVSVSKDLTVSGNLTVQGASTILNTSVLDVTDLNITVAKNATSAAEANEAGISVAGANATIQYIAATDRWQFNKNINVGTVYGSLSGTVTTASQPSITSVGTLTDITTSGNVTLNSAGKGIRFQDGSFQTTKYVLPTATDTTLGGIKIGSGLVIDNGVVSVNSSGGSQSFTDLTVTGNLTVNGDTAELNTSTLNVSDVNIMVAKNAATPAAANGAGLTVNGANATISYTSSNDRWNLNKNLVVNTVYGALSGNASTASQLQTARTIAATGDATWSVLFSGAASASAVLTLANSGVTSGTYGSGTTVPQVTVDAKGRVTSVANTPISFPPSGVTSVATLTGAITAANLATQLSGQAMSVNGTATNITAYSINQNLGTANSPTFGGLSLPDITHTGTSGVGNIGSSSQLFGTIYGVATSALYADLAEKYETDSEYQVGTVVVFGGTKEVTQSTMFADVSVAGVISTAPAYLMNSESPGQAVALKGKVPVRVIGAVRKGDLLVSSDIPGVAVSIRKMAAAYPCAVIAKAVQESDDISEKLIYAVII